MKNFKLFIESNIILALASVLLCLVSSLQSGGDVQPGAYHILIFFGVLLAYNVNQVFRLFAKSKTPDGSYTQWVRTHKIIFSPLIMVAVVGLIGSFIWINPEVQIALFFISIVAVLYSWPVIPVGGKWYSLREIPYLKIFLISIIWSVATVWLPVIQQGVLLTDSNTWLVFVERLIFLFALAIMFDVRDIESDKRKNLKTLPVLIGKQNSVLLSILLLLLFLSICMVHYISFENLSWPALLISGLSTMVFIVYLKNKSATYFHYRVFDCALLIQPILVFLFYFLD